MLPGGPSYEQASFHFGTVAWPKRSRTRPGRFKDSAISSNPHVIEVLGVK